MKNIEVQLLNPMALLEAEKMMVCAARLTQRGHSIKNMDELLDLFNKEYSDSTVAALVKLPHPTIQKFTAINFVIVGASRRFLAQVTRHQNEVKFMSASLQYSDYSGEAGFTVPYDLLGDDIAVDQYLDHCEAAMGEYASLVQQGHDNDAAGYLAPQGLRNILIISATPYQWKHMISQRVCRRNTAETRYVFLRIWSQLYKINPTFFGQSVTGPFCMKGRCLEGRMSCGSPIPKYKTPGEIIAHDFPLLTEARHADKAN